MEQDEVGDDSVVPGIAASLQTFGDLLNWHPHVHMLVTESVFTQGGHFVRVSQFDMDRCMRLWQDKVFDILLREEKITQSVVDNMRSWKHSGFSVNNDVGIGADDKDGIRRLTEYICRCPFSLARIISVNRDGKVIYRAVKKDAIPYPEHQSDLFRAGAPRNFQIFSPLDFLAEVTQHIPKKGSHQIRYYGHYSNKKRGIKRKTEKAASDKAMTEKGKACIRWAQLIKMVYAVDPLVCLRLRRTAET
jgi:hypothetical protein